MTFGFDSLCVIDLKQKHLSVNKLFMDVSTQSFGYLGIKT